MAYFIEKALLVNPSVVLSATKESMSFGCKCVTLNKYSVFLLSLYYKKYICALLQTKIKMMYTID